MHSLMFNYDHCFYASIYLSTLAAIYVNVHGGSGEEVERRYDVQCLRRRRMTKANLRPVLSNLSGPLQLNYVD